MFKLNLEEPEIKLPTSIGSSKKQESSRKISISALLSMPKSDCVNHNKLWKTLKVMEIPDHLTSLLKNLYVGQEGIVRAWQQNNWLVPNWQRIWQCCILSPCLFNLYAEYIIQNAGLDELQAGIKIARRNINKFRYANDTTLMAKVKRNERASWWLWNRRVKKLT